MSKIKTLNINININDKSSDEQVKDSEKMRLLIETLDLVSKDDFFINKTIRIPDGCRVHGFVSGTFSLPNMLKFISDMIEE